MVLQAGIRDVQVSDLKESQRLFGQLRHGIDLGFPGSEFGAWRGFAARPSSSDVFLIVFRAVLLTVMLRPLVVRAVFGLLRSELSHRVGGGADLAGLDDRSKRSGGAFAGYENFAALHQQLGK